METDLQGETRPTSVRAVTPAERRWVFVMGCLVMLVTTLPYLLGFGTQGASWRFSGFVFGLEDGNSYIAKMLSGETGAWLFRTPYSAETQRGAIMFLPYLLLGKLAAPPALHEQLLALYHLFRCAAGLLAALATYDFIAYFIPEVHLRRYGFILAFVGGGLGWLVVLIGKFGYNSLPVEFYSPESFGFLGIYGIPHLALARAFFLWGLVRYLSVAQSPAPRGLEVRKSFGVGLIWLLTCLSQPLIGMIQGLVVGIYLLVSLAWQAWPGQGLQRRDWPAYLRRVRVAVVAGLVPAPLILYSAAAFIFDPFLKVWAQQSPLSSASPGMYLLAYGLLVPFAVIGARRVWADDAWKGFFLAAWLAAFPLLAYSPFNMQRRLPEGIWVALVTAAVGAWMGKASRKSLGLILAVSLLSTLVLLAGGMLTAIHPAEPAFIPAAEAQVFADLAETARPGEVVLAAYESGNLLPAWSPVRVVIGHGPETAHFASINAEVKAFFGGKMVPAEQTAFLRQWDVRYVFWGPAERRLGSWDPSQAGFLTLLASQGDYSVYRVVP